MDMRPQIATLEALDMTCLAAGTVGADARQRIELRLSGWGLTRLADDAQLIAAELIANACAATPTGHIRIRFSRETGSVLLAVWDAGDLLPQVRPVRELELDDLDLREERFDDNGGWGLQLVQALSTECGVSRTRPNGKWVWARLSA